MVPDQTTNKVPSNDLNVTNTQTVPWFKQHIGAAQNETKMSMCSLEVSQRMNGNMTACDVMLDDVLKTIEISERWTDHKSGASEQWMFDGSFMALSKSKEHRC